MALTCLFIVSFVNIIFIREEFVEIPEIKSSNNESFIIPNEVKNNNYNFKILNHDNDNFLEKSKSKNFEVKINTENKNLLNKKNISDKEIKKFIVQLGAFKNKENGSEILQILFSVLSFEDFARDMKFKAAVARKKGRCKK